MVFYRMLLYYMSIYHFTCLVVQIEAHSGSVNDLAFSYPNKQLCIVTCGEDRLIKVCSLPMFLLH